jgi:small-conductance mechanosensitive channel
MLKIWIQGLEHFFTMLSIVAAGLVITNKETIMNFVGWLIINWRGIFVEGDYIKIEELSGYVHTIGPLFFKIYEADEIGIRQTTGKSIKIPNGLIITKPIVTYSPDTNLCRYKTECVIPYDSELNIIKDLFAKAINEVLHDCYKDDKTYCYRYIKDHNKELAKLIDLTPKVRAEPAIEGDKGIKITVVFFCYPINHRDIEQDFWGKIFSLQKSQKLHLLGDNAPYVPNEK